VFGVVQQIWTCVLCKKKQEILVKTGQWYHGSMAKPVTLDIDLGSDASSIKTDSSSVSDKRFSEAAARTLPTHDSGPYAGPPQASPMGGGPAYDPSRSLPPPSMGNEFGARPTPNGALGQTLVDSAGARRPLDPQTGRTMPETAGARQAADPAGRPLYDASGKPLMDQAGRAMVDASGRPMVDPSGRPLVDQVQPGRMDQTGRPGVVDPAAGRALVDQSRPQPEPQAGGARPLLDSTGRPLLDFAGNPIMDYSGGRQLPDSILRPSQPVAAAGYPDPGGRPPAADQAGRPMLDQAGRPLDHPDSSGGRAPVLTDVAGRALPDAVAPRSMTDQPGRPLPEHGVRGANDMGYNATPERSASQPKLDPAGRPMFDASGRMIMEPMPLDQTAHRIDAAGKTIVDPNFGPIGDLHGRVGPVLDPSAAGQQRFDVHGRPLGDVAGQDVARRPAAAPRGPEPPPSLSEAAMATEPSRGRLLPDVDSRGGGPPVQDWRGDGSQPPAPWPKDPRVPGPVQEPPPPLQGLVMQRAVEGDQAVAAAAWQSRETDPAITSGQQRPPPPQQRHVPGEAWRHQPPPHRYVTSVGWLVTLCVILYGM